MAGPATFSPNILATALAGEPLGLGYQAVIRDQLRLLVGKHGPVDRDVPQRLPRASHYTVPPLIPLGGAHLDNGLIQLNPTSHAAAIRFLNGARDVTAVAGMGSLVHEALHGHSPVGARWGELDVAAQRIDHLAIATATQAILVRELKVPPESVTTRTPYGINETIDLIARHAGLNRAAARNVLHDASLKYLGPGPETRSTEQVERRFIDAVNAAAGRNLDAVLRPHLRTLP